MAKATRWTPAETLAIAKAEAALCDELAARLEARGLNADFRSSLQTAIQTTEAGVAGQPVRLGSQKGATAAQGDVLVRVRAQVGAVREAIGRLYRGRGEILRGFGVGGPDPSDVTRALGAIKAVLGAAERYPAETAAAGILARDLQALAASQSQLWGSEMAQEGAKGAKKSGTAARDDLLRDLTRRVDQILAAASLEFVNEPQIAARFYAPIPTRGKKKPPTAGGSAG